MDNSNDDFTICCEDGIELGEIVDQTKREIDCFFCEEHFNSFSDLDAHLLAKHQMGLEKLSAYLKWQSNEVSKTKGKN